MFGGLLVIALGAWAALASSMLGGGGSGEWSADRILIALLPGAAAAVGGLGMTGVKPRAVTLGCLLAVAGGLWFMLAALTSVFWAVGTPALGGHELRMLQWIGFYFGTGAVIGVLGCHTLGWLDPPADMQTPVERSAAVRDRTAAACETRRRPRAAERSTRRSKRLHAGARARVHRRS